MKTIIFNGIIIIFFLSGCNRIKYSSTTTQTTQIAVATPTQNSYSSETTTPIPEFNATEIPKPPNIITNAPLYTSGIEGTVKAGPMCPGPVQVGNSKCEDQPYQATIAILTINKQFISEVQTDINGKFKLALPPGNYLLHPLSETAYPHAADQTVIVYLNQFTLVNINYDTGIR